jgi:aryl-alcohol dehydrogenase-like predicted oxidoreductase
MKYNFLTNQSPYSADIPVSPSFDGNDSLKSSPEDQGLWVSQISLGTMTWGEQNTQEEAFEQMDYALEHGVQFFDTAELYPVPPKEDTYTKTETIIGNWFRATQKREQVVLASKVAGPHPNMYWIREGRNKFDKSNIIQALEGSLSRLQTDYIDLYQLHWPNRATNFFGRLGYTYPNSGQELLEVSYQETLLTIQKLLQEGKIRYYGLSNETPWGMMTCFKIADELGMPRPISVQNPYSLLCRAYEIGNAEVSHREGIGLLAYSPLGFGVLSGKYLKGQKPKGSRLDVFSGHFGRYSSNPATSATNDYVRIAKKHDLSPSQMALAFVNQQPFCASTIIGATTMEQLQENIESIDVTLTDSILEEIESVHARISNPSP